MVLYELYQVLFEYTEIMLLNRDCEMIFDGFLSQLNANTLGTRVLHIDILSANRVSIVIDTTESEVK